MEESLFQLTFDGGLAAEGTLDFYDASISNYGLARTLAIVGHYYSTGEIIAQAPRSGAKVFITVPEDGSFKQTIIAATVAGVIAAPFTVFASRILEDWIPKSEDPQLKQIIELLKEQNEILRKEHGLPPDQTENEKQQSAIVDEHVRRNADEIQVLRSVTSNSFRNIFRPVGRSARTLAITSGPYQRPIRSADPSVVARIESERIDQDTIIIHGIVNSFSRSSKTGVMMSDDLGRGFRFQYEHPERLPREDIFSWSQYYGREIRVTGRFVRFYDGNIKKMLIYSAEPVLKEDK